MDLEKLKAMLRIHEGVRSRPYHDTIGRITVGVGRNLDDKPLKPQEIEFMLNGDVADAMADCNKFAWYSALSDNRQLAVADMMFNLGAEKFEKFTNMIDAIQSGDYDRAADEMLHSRWAWQVGQRAKDLADMMRAG